MKRSYTAPDDFEITPERLKWAMETFNISQSEVERQTEMWHEHEYQRAYFDWSRAWKRWFRCADKFGTLKRERKYTKPEQITPEMRADDQRKFDEQIKRFQSK